MVSGAFTLECTIRCPKGVESGYRQLNLAIVTLTQTQGERFFSCALEFSDIPLSVLRLSAERGFNFFCISRSLIHGGVVESGVAMTIPANGLRLLIVDCGLRIADSGLIMMINTLVCLAAGLTAVGQQDALGCVRVAVLNIPEVSEKYQRTADLEAHFENLRAEFNKERDALRERINRIRRSLREEFKPGTEEFRLRTKQLALLEAELNWFVESQGRKIEEGLRSSLLNIFNDIQEVVREVADEKGFDVVVAGSRMPDDPPASPTHVRQQILLQKVLYWNPRVDISNEVIVRLNARHRQRAAANPSGEPPPTQVDVGTAAAPRRNKP